MIPHIAFQPRRTGAGGGAQPPAVRLVPGDANTFYLVTYANGLARSVRFQRNLGGGTGNDLGGKWPEWRATGEGLLTGPNDDPSAPAVWIANDPGAQDVVGNSGAKFIGSFHGLGTGGGLNSETVKIDGVAVDPTAGAKSGATFELRNATTATDGTNTLIRDLSVTINPAGGLHFKVNSISASAGIAYIYLGMGIATGAAYTEMDVKLAAAWNSIPLGANDADARLNGTNAVRFRNPTTGHFLALTGALAAVAGYARAEVRKEAANNRSKSYLSRFTAYGSLAAVEWDLDWGLGSTGAVSPGANMLQDPSFAANWIATSGPAPSVSAGVATITQQATGTAVRFHHPQNGCASGSWYADSVDVGGSSPTILTIHAGSNVNGSNSSPGPAFSKPAAGAGRQIQVFQATQADPNQRFLFDVAGAGAGGATVTLTNPATYAITG